jgi:CheY-like chemotaxis protein
MDLSALRILLVDDNRQASQIVKTILNSLGANDVRFATTAEDAYRRLGLEAPIDLIIVDQNLGKGGEGVDLVRQIRRDPASPSPYVPILMLTGYSDQRRVLAARDAGISEFLVKPFTVAGLLRRLEALILQPRVFVRSEDYLGPDRRRRADPKYRGPERRRRE